MIDAYRLVTEEIPEVQLALVGSMATDDPEGWEFFHRTFEYADSDPDIKILNNLNNVGAIEVNAFQSQSDVVMQKSIREGFGLTVAEALWKGRPTIGGDVGGIPLQIVDGEDGYLVSSPEEAAKRSSRSSGTPSWAGASAGGQGAHPRALPDPAPAARLAADLHRPGYLGGAGGPRFSGLPDTNAGARSTPDDRLEPRAGRVRRRRRGAHRAPRRRRAGHGALRARLAPQSALDRLGDDRRGRRGRQRERRAGDDRGRRDRLRGADGRLEPDRVRPLLQRDRQPDPLVHPALPLGPLQRAGHPPGRGRRLGGGLQGRERRHRRRP